MTITGTTERQNRLEDEVRERSQEISTDAYAMSVGELISLYKDNELEIHPEFQRFFRWTPEQKSRFIESILLGIPIPSLFVSQTLDGRWEVIDGLQRISTLLEVVGELVDQEGLRKPPLRLLKTKYLPSLEGLIWDSQEDKGDELPASAKLKIKRSRMDLKIVLNSSDPKARFELFQRLNTGGTPATDQEVRNCVLLMVNRTFFEWVSAMAADVNFRRCIPLSERQLDEQYDLELVIRFIVLRALTEEQLREVGDLGTFLTDTSIRLAESPDFSREEEGMAFSATFELLAAALGENAFKKHDPTRNQAMGALLISVFEVMALGVGFHQLRDTGDLSVERVREVHRTLWQNELFTGSTGSGVRASSRIPITVPLGRDLFQHRVPRPAGG